MIPLPEFDQLYVISDLHMGGEPGHQIFGQEPLLSAFIDHLRTNAEGESALVINGDMVDFLAEPGAVCFDEAGAISKLNTIVSRFPAVWSALRAYVRAPRRKLVIVLGNHDLELALPWVRDALLETLAGADGNARARIRLCFDGAGFACKVGSRQVLCVHGNEVDDWNLTDYEKLRRIGMDLLQGRGVEGPWTPNAGSKLVINVMNGIKQAHAFIDLLKPEKEGAVRILLAMRPELRVKIADVVAILKSRFIVTPLRRAFNRLDEEAIENDTRAAADRALDRIMAGAGDRLTEHEVLSQVEDDFERGLDPLDLVYCGGSGQLSRWTAIRAAISGAKPHRVAWEAVKELASDQTYAIGQTDADYEKIDALAGANYDVVVAGHTHLARALPRKRVGRGWYFNTGTWAWLMRLNPKQLADADAFRPVFEQLAGASRIDDLGDLKFARPTVAVVTSGEEPALQQVSLRDGAVHVAPPEEHR